MKANEKQIVLCNSIIAQLNYWINNGFTSKYQFIDEVISMIDLNLIAEATDNDTMNEFRYSIGDVYDIIEKIK